MIRAVEEDIWTEDLLFVQVHSLFSILYIYGQKAAHLNNVSSLVVFGIISNEQQILKHLSALEMFRSFSLQS